MGFGKARVLQELFSEYKKKQPAIKKRLNEFKKVWEQSDSRIFSELCFCLCTPQSKAVSCDKAISDLEEKNILFNGSVSRIITGLKAVRFPNKKASYIVEARNFFTDNGILQIKHKIDTDNIHETRQRFVNDVKGFGFKEASHFLRNIGFGSDFAILDTHILKNMLKYGLIDKQPEALTKCQYLFLEDRLRQFSQKINIPMDELDLLFWSSQTGEIFK